METKTFTTTEENSAFQEGAICLNNICHSGGKYYNVETYTVIKSGIIYSYEREAHKDNIILHSYIPIDEQNGIFVEGYEDEYVQRLIGYGKDGVVFDTEDDNEETRDLCILALEEAKKIEIKNCWNVLFMIREDGRVCY